MPVRLSDASTWPTTLALRMGRGGSVLAVAAAKFWISDNSAELRPATASLGNWTTRCAVARAPARLGCWATKFRKAIDAPGAIVMLSHSDWTCPISVLPAEKIWATIVTGTRLNDAEVA